MVISAGSGFMLAPPAVAIPPLHCFGTIVLGLLIIAREGKSGRMPLLRCPNLRHADESFGGLSRPSPRGCVYPSKRPAWYTARATTNAMVVEYSVAKAAHFQEPLSRAITAMVVMQGA